MDGKLGVIGGTGLGSFEGFESKDERVDTPYGTIDVCVGALEGTDLVFLPRHGQGHLVPPHRVN
jgi:5'-methylthioadenosine phosphorylase